MRQLEGTWKITDFNEVKRNRRKRDVRVLMKEGVQRRGILDKAKGRSQLGHVDLAKGHTCCHSSGVTMHQSNGEFHPGGAREGAMRAY